MGKHRPRMMKATLRYVGSQISDSFPGLAGALALAILLGATPSYASSEDIRTLVLPDEKAHEFRLVRGKTREGKLEIRVDHVEMRSLFPATRATVLWGRDTDRDGLADAWFFYDENGLIVGKEYDSQQTDGWDAAAALLVDRVDFANRWWMGMVAETVFSSVSSVWSERRKIFDDHLRRQINLREREILLARWARIFPADPRLAHEYGTLSDEWEEISKEVGSLLDGWMKITGMDMVLSSIGYGSTRLIGKGLGWAQSRIGSGELGTFLRRRLAVMGEQVAKFRGNGRRLPEAARVVTGHGLSAAAKYAKLPARMRGEISYQTLSVGAELAKRMAISGAHATMSGVRTAGGIGYRTIKAHAGYVTLSQSLQVGVELKSESNRHLWGPDLFTTLNNFRSDEQVKKNVLFMTSETILLSLIHGSFPNMRLSKRLMAGGLVAMANSSFLKFKVFREDDTDGVALDVSWEVIVGNTQVSMDKGVERYFHALADARGNPYFRAVGYAFVLADQTAGYQGYNCMTSALGRMKGTSPSEASGTLDRLCDWAIDRGVSAKQSATQKIDAFKNAGITIMSVYAPK
jgi:hypothetical protein